MKKFDPDSIYLRLKDRARKSKDFAIVAEDSVINAIFKAQADALAEIVRYMEYLLAEKKWSTAQNLTSLISLAKMIGYKPKRKRSAIGEIIVSHDERLRDYGIKFFNLDAKSEFDFIVEDPTATAEEKLALRPFGTSTFTNPPYTISAGDIFTGRNGKQYIALKTKSIKPYTTPFTEEEINSPHFSWEGYKYLRIPVIEGIVRTVSISLPETVSDFFTITLNTENCEDASNSFSEPFFSVSINTAGIPSEYQSLGGTWKRIDSLVMAGPYDKVYEVYNSIDYQKVYIRFGNNVNGVKPPPGAILTVKYLETSGEQGNVDQRFQINKVLQVLSANGNTLYCTNDQSILGGANFERIPEIRSNAPLEYLKFYSVSTVDSYETLIKSYIPGIDKVKVFGGRYTDELTGNEKDVVYVSIINTLGKTLETKAEEDSFIRQVVDLIGPRKSPTDTLYYSRPRLIPLRLNSIIYTSNRVLTEDQIRLELKELLFKKYSIFNRNFKEPFYLSDYNYVVNSPEFVKYSETFIEAIVEIDFKEYSYDPINQMFKFYFQYDKIFGQDPLFAGFKTKPGNSVEFLLRAELVWKSAQDSAKNRILFLLDTRSSLSSTTGLRTAQYPYFRNIVFDNRRMINQFLPLDRYPQENFYWLRDTLGNYILKNPSLPDTPSNRVRNPNFIGNITNRKVELYFSEDYNVNSPNYAKGYITLPAIPQTTVDPEDTGYLDYSSGNVDNFVRSLKDKLTIRIYAQPLLTNIIPDIDNTIIYTPEDEIVTEAIYV